MTNVHKRFATVWLIFKNVVQKLFVLTFLLDLVNFCRKFGNLIIFSYQLATFQNSLSAAQLLLFDFFNNFLLNVFQSQWAFECGLIAFKNVVKATDEGANGSFFLLRCFNYHFPFVLIKVSSLFKVFECDLKFGWDLKKPVGLRSLSFAILAKFRSRSFNESIFFKHCRKIE